MSLEQENHAQTPEKPKDRSRSVVTYIFILFIAAFLLMALSSLMHQRSNTEALGALQSSVSTLQELQAAQERIIELQEELDETKEYLETFEDAAEATRNQASHAEYRLEQTREAMDLFWQLDEAYVLEDTERCRQILAEMNRNQENPLGEYLSEQAADRYTEICQALDPS